MYDILHILNLLTIVGIVGILIYKLVVEIENNEIGVIVTICIVLPVVLLCGLCYAVFLIKIFMSTCCIKRDNAIGITIHDNPSFSTDYGSVEIYNASIKDNDTKSIDQYKSAAKKDGFIITV
jgi:hypothetical protein